MIHSAFNKSEIARLYYLSKTGEDLLPRVALNRFLHVKVDNTVLKKVLLKVITEQKKSL